jgi:hypothetical protein
MTASRPIASMLVAAAFAGACLDLSPLPYEGPVGGGVPDVSVPDVGLDVSRADALVGADALGGACPQCLKIKCASAEKACEKSVECSKFSACMNATQCWGSSVTNLTNLSPCLLQCATAGNVTGQDDPVAALIAPLISCAQDPADCAGACLGTEQ